MHHPVGQLRSGVCIVATAAVVVPLFGAGPAAAAAGTISTIAGTGDDGFSGDGGGATDADLAGASGVVTFGGSTFFADVLEHRVSVQRTGRCDDAGPFRVL
jgi:hypothetical protein